MAFLEHSPFCAECGKPATDLDHIDGNARNNDLRNLRPLCHSHHSARTAREQSFNKRRNKRMAKKKAGRKPAPKARPSEERASFLPGDDEAKKPEEKLDVAVSVEEDLLETSSGIQLSVKRGADRRLEVSLTIPPLEPWTEREIWPLPGTAPEHLAGKIAGAIERAAHTVAHDASVQYARRLNEEAEAKERLAKRA